MVSGSCHGHDVSPRKEGVPGRGGSQSRQSVSADPCFSRAGSVWLKSTRPSLSSCRRSLLRIISISTLICRRKSSSQKSRKVTARQNPDSTICSDVSVALANSTRRSGRFRHETEQRAFCATRPQEGGVCWRTVADLLRCHRLSMHYTSTRNRPFGISSPAAKLGL